LMRLLRKRYSLTVNLPRVRRVLLTDFLQEVRNVYAIRVVFLSELEACGCGEPRYILAAIADVDFVAALDELRGLNVDDDLHN
jgi:hypothetical protein